MCNMEDNVCNQWDAIWRKEKIQYILNLEKIVHFRKAKKLQKEEGAFWSEMWAEVRWNELLHTRR